ncbi:DUF3817 domain-containing protein [Brevibacillus massiliensis]|jgi:integral membrane protein|uniref:DUF3817 domain-containing protein n=1 Tax=Brevibacillus massiliensis TaxID=1118054 RepID=UPI00036CA1E4|nr:DUF3817 domain-containing protein [Brevibacillus massiliensis]
MLKTSLGRLRLIGYIEGVSFLLLLGIAMPLKYMAGFPEPVKIIGWLHGIFFVLYLLAVIQTTIAHRWSILRVLGAFLASIIPFGPFILDARLRRE